MNKKLTAALAVTTALAGAAPATAAILPGVAVDGPSNLIDTASPRIDVAPDGSAALVYLKTVGAQAHPFVSRFVNGAWTAPEQVDPGVNDSNSNVRIAVANGGKVVVTYRRNTADEAIARISPAPGAAFGPEQVLLPQGQYAEVDLSPNGNGYVVMATASDVYARRLVGDTWSPVGAGALDSNPANTAGDGNRAAVAATTADGSGGVIAWGEDLGGGQGEVFVRRLTGTGAGNALPTRARLGFAPGSNAGSGQTADQAAIDVDAGGTAWVVFRQNYEYGMATRHRAIARPITGDSVGAPQLVDTMGAAPPEGRDYQQVDVNGAGQGLLSHHGNLTSGLEWASLAGGTWTTGGLVNLSDNASVPGGIPALGENGSGMIAYAFKAGAGANTAKARTTFGGLGAEIELSNPAFGELLGSLDAAAGSGSYGAATFLQQVAADATTRRVVAAVVDLPQPPVVNPPPPPPPPPLADTTKPDITRLRLTRRVFRLGGRGTVIKWTQSEDARVTIRFARRVNGRFRRLRRKMAFQSTAGNHRLRFRGRFDRKHPLKPGRYRMTFTARDAAGNVSLPDRVRFRLLPRLQPRR